MNCSGRCNKYSQSTKGTEAGETEVYKTLRKSYNQHKEGKECELREHKTVERNKYEA